MELCHDRCVELLDNFLGSMILRGSVRALDVAGGDARVASSHVMKSYRHVDLFDQCPIAIKKASSVMKQMKNCGNIIQSSQQ